MLNIWLTLPSHSRVELFFLKPVMQGVSALHKNDPGVLMHSSFRLQGRLMHSSISEIGAVLKLQTLSQ